MPGKTLVKDIILAAPPVALSIFGVALGDIAAIVSISWVCFLAGAKLYYYLKEKRKIKGET
jgi:hypothetical protein